MFLCIWSCPSGSWTYWFLFSEKGPFRAICMCSCNICLKCSGCRAKGELLSIRSCSIYSLHTKTFYIFSWLHVSVSRLATRATLQCQNLVFSAMSATYRHVWNVLYRRKRGTHTLQVVGRDLALCPHFARSGGLAATAGCQRYNWLAGSARSVPSPCNQFSHWTIGSSVIAKQLIKWGQTLCATTIQSIVSPDHWTAICVI